MKELLDRLVVLIPRYVADLMRLVPGPKRFVLERTANAEAHLTDALLFLAISIVIAWILEISFTRRDPVLELLVDAAFIGFFVLLFGGALCVAWRVVKGRAEINKFFVIHLYYAGVMKLIMVSGFLATMGVLRAGEQGFYDQFMEAIYAGQAASFVIMNSDTFMENPIAIPLILTTVVSQIVLIVWIISGWGAYREINALSRLRSAGAFILTMFFSVPVAAVATLLANAAVR